MNTNTNTRSLGLCRWHYIPIRCRSIPNYPLFPSLPPSHPANSLQRAMKTHPLRMTSWRNLRVNMTSVTRHRSIGSTSALTGEMLLDVIYVGVVYHRFVWFNSLLLTLENTHATLCALHKRVSWHPYTVTHIVKRLYCSYALTITFSKTCIKTCTPTHAQTHKKHFIRINKYWVIRKLATVMLPGRFSKTLKEGIVKSA